MGDFYIQDSAQGVCKRVMAAWDLYIHLSAQGVCKWSGDRDASKFHLESCLDAVATRIICCPHPSPPPRGRGQFGGLDSLGVRCSCVFTRQSARGGT